LRKTKEIIMGRLFWKIFLAFLGTSLIINLSVIGMIWLYQNENHLPVNTLQASKSMISLTSLSPSIWMLIGLLASLLVSTLLSLYIARPVRYLRQVFKEIGAGNFNIKISPKFKGRRDELSELSNDFDNMVRKFEKLMVAQQNLLHDVSHELRSPLARMHAAVGLVRQNPLKIEETILRIEREANQLDELVGELLTLSRLDSGILQQQKIERIALVESVAQIADDADFEAVSYNKSVNFIQPKIEVWLDAQPELLYRAIENIIRNAVKYSEENTTIDVWIVLESAEDGEFVLIGVMDQGPGVPEKDLEHIFKPFVRVDNQPRGFGLGLAISERAVTAHKGTIVAQNRTDTHGLIMTIRLPLTTQRRRSRTEASTV
jgi:two-component system OmpR family sensor kinase